MNGLKYVVNTAQDVVPVDENVIAIRTLSERSLTKGAHIATAMQDVLGGFKEPAFLDDVVLALSDKCSIASLKRINA